jgi:hypothetical protein
LIEGAPDKTRYLQPDGCRIPSPASAAFQSKTARTQMTEERKRSILFAAILLSTRKLIEMQPDKPNRGTAILWTRQSMMQRSSSKRLISTGPNNEDARTVRTASVYRPFKPTCLDSRISNIIACRYGGSA